MRFIDTISTSGQVQIKLERQQSDVEVEVVDLNGTIVYSNHYSNIELVKLDASWPEGVYGCCYQV